LWFLTRTRYFCLDDATNPFDQNNLIGRLKARREISTGAHFSLHNF
jgi:hypothetical protein